MLTCSVYRKGSDNGKIELVILPDDRRQGCTFTKDGITYEFLGFISDDEKFISMPGMGNNFGIKQTEKYGKWTFVDMGDAEDEPEEKTMA